MYQQTLPWIVNYDEKEIPPYTLPELLQCEDGTRVTTSEQWLEKRRPELLQRFREVMYGEDLPLPDHVSYELLDETPGALGGIATRRQVRLVFRQNDGREHSAIMLLYIPADQPAPVPVFVGLTFGGNHVVSEDPGVYLTGLVGPGTGHFPEMYQARGSSSRRFPLDYIMGRGYAVAVCSYNDFFPDRPNGWQASALSLFLSREELSSHPDNYTCIGTWSWGLSRMLDCLEGMPDIDAERAACFGHSRLGKTSLWTGVRDERFKLACVNDSGCGGAALSRRLYGETLFSMTNFHSVGYWFQRTLKEKALHPENLPIDQHELIALMAPRCVAVHSATLDQWADPVSEYLSAYHAGPVFRLFGMQPLSSATPPAPDTAVGTDVSYFLRTGKHDMLKADWKQYLDAADRIFR
ncbi:MAG: hypothetical protein IJJ33_15700 [Victivallales bacterium]|nr:hypothetical protein [Victivallales bacterium]